jgi:hypothetical protein
MMRPEEIRMETTKGSTASREGDADAWAAAAEEARADISPEERRRRIAEAAYYYSLQRNGDDRALDDWIQAEGDIDRELREQSSRTGAQGTRAGAAD